MKFSLKKLALVTALLGVIVMATAVSAFAAEARLGQVKASSLRFRAAPSLNGREMSRIPNGATILILDSVENGEWYSVVHNYTTGYVAAEYVVIRPDADMPLGDGICTGSNVNVRGGPSLTAGIQAQINRGDRVDIIGVSEGWFKVTHDGAVGYIHADYIAIERPVQVMAQPNHVPIDDDVEPELMDGDGDYIGGADEFIPAAAVDTDTMSGLQAEIVAFARNYLGKSYKYGTSGPNTFDCSGFTTFVFKNFGYSLNRSSAGQLSNGTPVQKSDIIIGDLVLFRDPSINKAAASHVGMYIGNGQFIHASSRRGGVIITSLSEAYYSRYFVGARRVL